MINPSPQEHSAPIGSRGHLRSPRKLERGARLTRLLVALGSALAVTAGLLTAVAPAASAADSTTYLGEFPGGGDVAAGGGKVFVAAGGRIIVADTQGTVTGDVTGLSDAVHLAITPDGTRLYAALRDSKQVAEIDTADLTVTRRIDLAPYPCPGNLSLSGSRLWIGYGCDNDDWWVSGVVSLDLSATAPEPVRIETSRMLNAPLVVAAGNTLVVAEPGTSAADLMVYDTSVTPAILRGVISGEMYGGLSRLRDLAITPDGSMVVSSCGAPYRFDGWDTTSLTRVRTYDREPTSTSYPRAVAISPDGAHVAGGWVSGNRADIALYNTETTAKTYTYDNRADEVVAGSLTFSGADVFGLLKDLRTNRLHLWRLHGGTLPASTMTLTAPSTATVFKPLTMTGRLTLPDGSAPGAQPLVVTRRLPDGTSTTLTGVTTAADGTFTITDTPPIGGAISYDVLWNGNSDFRWSRKPATVTVGKHQSSLALSGPAEGIARKQLQFSGALDTGDQAPPPGASLTVQRTVSNRNGTITTTLPAVTPASDGSFSFTDTPTEGGAYKYTVQWAGDDSFLPAQASHDVTVTKIQSSLTLSGPATGSTRKQLQFSGALDTGDQAPPPGASLTVQRTVSNRNGTVTTTLPAVTPASDGSFSFTDTPTEGGAYKYTVQWAGDDTFLSAQASHDVTVQGGHG
ncbi:hypothetical protein ACQP25_30875 [Microtetraspora malaysiensis]|uniref:YncE family protein n=1 Tax=Microtetraspora malaysiensis TaxID=161358 RepID=UPI003D8FEEA1